MDFKDIQNFKKDLLTLVKLDKTGEIKKIYQEFLKNEAHGTFLKMNAEQMRRMEAPALKRATDAISKLAGEIAEAVEERLAPEEILLVSTTMRAYSNRMRDMEAGHGRSKREAVSPISTDVEAMLENFKPLHQAENPAKAADMIVNAMGNDFKPYRMLASADKIERNMLKYAADDGFENIMGEIDDLNCKYNIYTGINELQGQLKELKKLENTEKHELMNADYKEVGRMANVARMEFRLGSYKKALELGWPVRDLNTYARIDSYLRDHNGPEVNQIKNILNAPLNGEADRNFYYQTFKIAFTNICAKDPDDRLAANISMVIDKHINDVMSEGEIENMKPVNKSRNFDIEYDENGMPVHDDAADQELDEEMEELENGGARREINDLEAEQLLKETENEVNAGQPNNGGAVENFFANAGEELLNNEEIGAEMENLEAQAVNEEAANENNNANDNVDENVNNEVGENHAENEEQNAQDNNNVQENGEQNVQEENVEEVIENNEENVEQVIENNEENANFEEEENKEEEKKEEEKKEEEKKNEELRREEERKEEQKAEEEKEAEEKAAEEKAPEIEKLSHEEYSSIFDRLSEAFANIEELIDMNKEFSELGSAIRKQNPQRDEPTFQLMRAISTCEHLGENCTISEMKEAYGKLVTQVNAYLKNMDEGVYNSLHNNGLRDMFEGIRDKAKEIFDSIDEKVLLGDDDALAFDKPLSTLKNDLQTEMDTLSEEYNKYGGRIKKEEKKEEAAQEEKEEEFIIEENKEEEKKEEKKEDEFDPEDFVIEENEDLKENEDKKNRKEAEKEGFVFVDNKGREEKDEPEKEEPKKEENKKEEPKKEEPKKEEPKKEEFYREAVNVEGWGKEHFVYESKYSKKTNVETLKKEEEKENKKEPKKDYGKLRISKGANIELKAEKDDVMNNNRPMLPKNK